MNKDYKVICDFNGDMNEVRIFEDDVILDANVNVLDNKKYVYGRSRNQCAWVYVPFALCVEVKLRHKKEEKVKKEVLYTIIYDDEVFASGVKKSELNNKIQDLCDTYEDTDQELIKILQENDIKVEIVKSIKIVGLN